jgi:hypothetical protein
MDCSTVDILWLSEGFWGARTGNLTLNKLGGTAINAYFRKGGTFWID